MSTNSNILHLSPEVIASWPTPNYEDPDRETWMPIYSPIWFAAATTMVAMRYWLRARGHAGKLGLDDVRHQREKRVGGIMADDLKGDFVPCLGGGIDVYDSDGHVYGTSTR
jgi:hypothetical protein